MLRVGGSAALRTRFPAKLSEVDRSRVLLQGPRFFEAPMASLLHVRLPGCKTSERLGVYLPEPESGNVDQR